MRSLLGGIAQAIANRAPVSYAPPGAGRLSIPWLGANGAEAQMRAMGSVGTLFAIVNRTSTAVAALNWRLYRKAASGRTEDRIEVTRHAALDLWDKPNRFYTRQELVESVQQHIDLTGEGWTVIGRDSRARSIPLELWPVRPDRMQPVPDARDFLVGYVYRGPNGEEVPLQLDDVMQIRMPHPLDPYRGMGAVQSILIDLDSAKYSAEWNRNFFLNSAEPGGIIEVDKRLTDDEFDEMSARWNEQHKGVVNAHRVALIEQGKWVNRTFTMRDMQFAELRSVSREEIMVAFGIPKFAIGIIDDVNRATADASSAWFARYLTVPRADRWKQMLNNDLLPLFGETARGLEFDYDSPVDEDQEATNAERTSKAAAAKTLVDAGFDPAAVLEVVGLPPMKVKPTPTPPALPPPPPAAPVARHHHHPVRNQDDPPEEASADEGMEDWEIALAALLLTWAGIAAAQRDELADQIQVAVDRGDLTALAGLVVTSADGAAELGDAMTAQAVRAAQRMLDSAAAQGVTGVPDVTVDTAGLDATARVTAALMASGLADAAAGEALRVWGPESTGEQVAAAVTEHLEGLSDRYLRDRLGGGLWQAEGSGRLSALEALPPARYVADEIRDKNTCDYCRKVDGTEYATLAEAREDYPSGAAYRYCAGGIRCRGTIEAVWS